MHPSRNNDISQSPIHSARDNASLRSASLGKSSLAPIDRLSTAGKVEPSVSATSGNSFGAETTVGRTTSTASASQSLQSIIRKSSNSSLAGSPTNAPKLNQQIASASDDSTSIATSTHVPTAFIGTVLEGHSFTPSASLSTPSTVMKISQPEASIDTTAAETTTAQEDQPAYLTPTTQTRDFTLPTALPGSVERARTTSSDSSSARRSSMTAFATWWSGSSSTNPGTNSAHEKTYTQPHGLSLRTSMLNMSTTASSQTSSTETPNTTASGSESATTPQSKLDTSDSMDWEPSGPETAILKKTRGLANHTSSSLPSSLPSSATFPSSMIKHTKPTASSVSERRGSTSSTQGLFTSILWSKLSTSQDSFAATTTTESSPLVKVTSVEHVPVVMMSETSNAMDVDGVQVQNVGLEISPTHGKDADDPLAKIADTTPKPTSTAAKLSDAQPSSSKKLWSIFGYSTKDDIETGSSKLRKSGDVLIEPESRPSSINEVVPALPSSASPTTLVAASTTTATPSTTTVTTTDAPTSVSTTAVTSTSPAAAKKSTESGPGSRTPPQNQVTDQIADPSDETGPVAPALVGTSQLNVVVPPGSAAVKIKDEAPTNNTGTVSSSYSWLSIIPGLGNKMEEANKTKEDMVASHQITDYQEGDRKDIDGNTISFKEKQHGRTFAQLAEAKNASENGLTPKDDIKDGPKERQAFAQIKERENQESGVAKEAGKAVASLSKVILRKKNVVLPNYYDQYPDVHPSLIALPEELPLREPSRARSASIMKSAVNVISNLLFSNPNSPQVPTSPHLESQHRGTNGIKKVAIIGVHGWFPVKLIRTVIGEPTGTSKKFCDEMHSALKEYLKIHNVELEPENCTLIPLEGEGKVLSRVEILYQNLVKNEQWKKALHEADLVLVATHSQGTPTSTLLVARLIEEGMLRVAEEDPKMQRVGILAMAGISHGPFPFLKGYLIVRWFEAEAAQELFEFMDSETEIAKKYREALQVVLSSGVRFTCVASLEDQVVPLYSAVMTSIHHPSIVRAVYIDGATYQDDFLTNLISFSLRLRNSGVDDHGVLLHLSEVVAGSIYGEGHSAIYEEREVYLLAIRSLLEPPKSLTPALARSEPILHPFRAKQTLNPFYLPWGMRGVMDEIKACGDEVLKAEMERLKKLYDEWNPVSKGMKEIKFRLEPVRSKL